MSIMVSCAPTRAKYPEMGWFPRFFRTCLPPPCDATLPLALCASPLTPVNAFGDPLNSIASISTFTGGTWIVSKHIVII